MNREEAESVYRDNRGDWYSDFAMLEDLACRTHRTKDEIEEMWEEARREFAVGVLMEEEGV